MRGVNAVRNMVLVFLASVLVTGALAACGGGGYNGGNIGGGSSAPVDVGSGGAPVDVGSGGTPAGAGSGGSLVTGVITWPDQTLAVNATVDFINSDPSFNGFGNGWSPEVDNNGSPDGNWYEVVQQLPADGSYSLAGCPCADLIAFLDLPPVSGADTPDGGRGCIIIMQDDNGTYSGLAANPGDLINWHVLDMNCSPDFYPPSQSSVQSERVITDPSQNGGDYTMYAGTWQAAESRTSGS